MEQINECIFFSETASFSTKGKRPMQKGSTKHLILVIAGQVMTSMKKQTQVRISLSTHLILQRMVCKKKGVDKLKKQVSSWIVPTIGGCQSLALNHKKLVLPNQIMVNRSKINASIRAEGSKTRELK